MGAEFSVRGLYTTRQKVTLLPGLFYTFPNTVKNRTEK
jgi:hypothetical protein